MLHTCGAMVLLETDTWLNPVKKVTCCHYLIRSPQVSGMVATVTVGLLHCVGGGAHLEWPYRADD